MSSLLFPHLISTPWISDRPPYIHPSIHPSIYLSTRNISFDDYIDPDWHPPPFEAHGTWYRCVYMYMY